MITQDNITWTVKQAQVQGDTGQLNMAVGFWYLVKIDLSSVHVYSFLLWTGHFYKVSEKHVHVYLVRLLLSVSVSVCN